jgi:hypothetical protein
LPPRPGAYRNSLASHIRETGEKTIMRIANKWLQTVGFSHIWKMGQVADMSFVTVLH